MPGRPRARQARQYENPVKWRWHSNLLHDGGEKWLRVEESTEPDRRRQLEVRYPRLEFSDSEQQIRIPRRQAVHRRVSSLQPRVWNCVQVQSVSQNLHVGSDCQLALKITASRLNDQCKTHQHFFCSSKFQDKINGGYRGSEKLQKGVIS